MCDCEMVFEGQYNGSAEKHGMKNTKLYQTWKAIKARCFSSKNKNTIKSYRVKNIGMCKQWSSFAVFYKDMGDKPTETHSIDRADNSLGYCPHNCRWATKREQATNRDCCSKRVIKNKDLPTGVKKQSKSNTYYASISHNRKYYYLGSFKTPKEAHEAYLKKKKELDN